MNEKQTLPKKVSDELADKLSDWRRANPKATLTEIEEVVEAELAQIRKELVTTLAQAGEKSDSESPNCPQCRRVMVKNGHKRRHLKSKEGQTIQLERQQWRCLGCGTTLFPPG